MSGCDHVDFGVDADVARITEHEGGDVVAYSVDLRVICLGCGEPFVFRGDYPLGASQHCATRSLDGRVLCVPIAPQSKPNAGHFLPGVTGRIID